MANNKVNSNQAKVKKIDLLYMSPSEVTAKDIAVLLQNENGLTIELWEAMNVLELVLPNQNSIDFEPLEVSFKDPSDASFVKNRNIITIFAVNLCEEDLTIATACFEKIVDKFSGFLCADSEDFNPVYVGSSKK
jgi:hypothetical protein